MDGTRLYGVPAAINAVKRGKVYAPMDATAPTATHAIISATRNQKNQG